MDFKKIKIEKLSDVKGGSDRRRVGLPDLGGPWPDFLECMDDGGDGPPPWPGPNDTTGGPQDFTGVEGLCVCGCSC